ncbi:MAG TPA: SURF1 family protein [Acidimicrobiales bacterium]
MSRYRFLRQPRWVLFSALMLGLVVLMVNLALWQLRRLDEKRARNDRIAEAVAAAPLTLGNSSDLPEWRTVSATGTYDVAHQVLIRNRSFDGQAGFHVVTPLRLPDGRALLVNRGWIPLVSAGSDAPAPPPPPTGRVSVNGRVRPSQHKGRFLSPTDPPEGTLEQLYRVDVPRIAQQVPYQLLPKYIELISTAPEPTAPAPALIPVPEPDEGPHLAYAGQWIFFSCCAVAGWILVVRRTAKASSTSVAAPANPTEPLEVSTSQEATPHGPR